MNSFHEHHKDSIRWHYRCFDRILLNGLIQLFQQPERVVGFFNTYRQLYPVSRNTLRGIASLRYDLSKLRAKDLVARLPNSRRYQLLPQGYSVCLVFLKLFERVYAPLTAGVLSPVSADARIPDQRRSQLDRLYRRVVDDLDAWSRLLGSKPLHDNTAQREQNPHYGHYNGLEGMGRSLLLPSALTMSGKYFRTCSRSLSFSSSLSSEYGVAI
jgi:hypothetical protein